MCRAMPRAKSLREALGFERPPPPTPATRRLRLLILCTAAATIVVDLVNLRYAPEAGFGLAVRTIWALLRALGFLLLMRAVRFGRFSARPFGLILAATTVFSVARLVQPRDGDLLPPWPVLAGLLVLTVLCGLVIWMLFRSPAIQEHLNRKPPKRYVPPWLLTARVAALSYGALLMVPCLVAVGTLFDEPRLERAIAVPIVFAWLGLTLLLSFVTSVISFGVLFDKGWARAGLAVLSVLVLLVQPVLCWLLLGLDGLIRDGGPLVLAVGLCLYALRRSGDTLPP
jgi:hypothetical protein